MKKSAVLDEDKLALSFFLYSFLVLKYVLLLMPYNCMATLKIKQELMSNYGKQLLTFTPDKYLTGQQLTRIILRTFAEDLRILIKRNTMKNTIIYLITALLLTLGLTSCSNGKNDPEESALVGTKWE